MSETEYAAWQQHEINRGAYWIQLTPDEYGRAQSDAGYAHLMRTTAMRDRLADQLKLLTGYSRGTGARVVVSPGNDDPTELDDFMREFASDEMLCGIENVLDLDGVALLSMSAVTPTPWHTYREVAEEALSQTISRLCRQAGEKTVKVFNFHCPPKPTALDLAPALDAERAAILEGGSCVMAHVGSEAVLHGILEHAPLLSLHGHVHESAAIVTLGTTLAVNPGSEYFAGVLHAFFCEISDKRIVSHTRIER